MEIYKFIDSLEGLFLPEFYNYIFFNNPEFLYKLSDITLKSYLCGQLKIYEVVKDKVVLKDSILKNLITTPLKEVIKYFISKNLITSDQIRKIKAASFNVNFNLANYMRNSFYITSVNNTKELNALKLKLSNFIKGYDRNQSPAEIKEIFNKEFKESEIGKLSNSHISTILRTNLATAFDEGQYNFLKKPEINSNIGIMRYDAICDHRTRATHKFMDGFYLKLNDPLFNKIKTPCGYNCRCSWAPVLKDSAIDRGYLNDQYQIIDTEKRNKQIELINSGLFPDPGFK